MNEKNMQPDLTEKLRAYVSAFNAADDELYAQEIPNEAAFSYLLKNAPLLDCPDRELETTYYFRLWTLRKHWKQTPFGHVLTEFLPPVGWAGPYNTVNCAVGHHITEARWLADAPERLWEYICFWLDGHGDVPYSMWLAAAVEAYFRIHPDTDRMRCALPKLDRLYREKEAAALRPCGLFWSHDGYDGMEYSVSGSGLRPTLNSYMCGDAFAIARMAQAVGDNALARAYKERGEGLVDRMNALLWDGDFYRTIPCEADAPADWTSRPAVPDDRRVRELTGYLPWYFRLASPEKDGAFRQLFDPNGFASPYGLTTAERRHPRFLFPHAHECLWNGYVWPFATAQTLTALANMIRDRGAASPVSNEEYYALLRQYALCHRLREADGSVRCWIDEDMHPFTGRWYARDELARRASEPGCVRERGKDYNHSAFCDLVLSGLLGIGFENGVLTARPIVPRAWDYFAVTGLTAENFTVLYDRTGTRYGLGPGLRCFRAEE